MPLDAVAASGTRVSTIRRRCVWAMDGDLFVANRGNENNFGSRVNRVRMGGPGDEDLLAEFCKFGEADGARDLAVWCRRRHAKATCTYRMNGRTRFRCSMPAVNSSVSGGKTGSGVGGTESPGLAWCARRTAMSSSSTAATIVCRCLRRTASRWLRSASRAPETVNSTSHGASRSTRTATSTSPTGRTIACRNGRRAASFLMSIGRYGNRPGRKSNAFAVTYLGPFVSSLPESEYPEGGRASNHPTDVAVDPDGDIYVTDWGNHRVSIFDAEGSPLTNLVGRRPGDVEMGPAECRCESRHDEGVPARAQAWSRCGGSASRRRLSSIRRRMKSSSPTVRGNRLQVYRKVRDYVDFQANL